MDARMDAKTHVKLTLYSPKKLDRKWSLWKGRRQETTLSEGEQGEKAKMLKKIGMKISEKENFGVMNASLKVLGPIVKLKKIYTVFNIQYDDIVCILYANVCMGCVKNECLRLSVKNGGGSVLVWDCISANGVGDIVRIDGIIMLKSTDRF